jgi:hypothetical protein
VNSGDKAKFVSSDVKHKYIAHFIGAGEEGSQLCKIMPIGFLAKAIPLIQRTGALGMRSLRCHNPAMGNNVHSTIISQ